MFHRSCVALCASILLSAAALGQGTHALLPDSFQVVPGQPVRLRVESRRGDTTETAVWPAQRVGWYFLRNGGIQENRDAIAPRDPGERTVAQAIPHAGAAVIGLDLEPVIENWTQAGLDAFVNEFRSGSHTVPRIPEANDPVLRVRRVESLRTLVRAIPAGIEGNTSASTTILAKTGQAVEIRLMADPTIAATGSDIPIKAYVRGDKCANANGRAICLGDGSVQTFTTDPTGAAFFKLTHGGIWWIEFRHAEKSDDPADHDWTIYSASLTFEVRP